MTDLLVDLDDGGALYAGLFSANIFIENVDRASGLYRSRDGSRSWAQLSDGISHSLHITRMAWHPTEAGTLYAAMWCSGVNDITVRE